METALATTHESSQAIINLDQLPGALELFEEGRLDPILERIEAEALSLEADTSTAKGRTEIASMAHKVARSKTRLDEAGKELTAGWRKRTDAVNETRRKLRDFLDSLKARVRAPLDEWEAAEAERKAEEERQAAMAAVWDEAHTMDELRDLRMEKEAREAEERKLAEERERQEAEKERQAMEAKRQAELEEERKAQEAERIRQAEERARTEERRRQEALERERQEAEAAKAAEAQAKALNAEHRASCNRAAASALEELGLDADKAQEVVKAIVQRRIPRVSITY